ncbi:hypothetical protein CmeUKMEL1_10150 [Cryptosporidium meleagridis]|uniref:Uncharacterized protein n=1 Tax=Cryptosporidium meleagridis TaxID=93969 RepID=A0A2P4Z1U9_9CRYT|nr:hypothetical protein CmeUKMEL1_10150 [Cryptosporidium meleagridis]
MGSIEELYSKVVKPRSKIKPLTRRNLKDLIKKSKAGTNQKTLRRNSSPRDKGLRSKKRTSSSSISSSFTPFPPPPPPQLPPHPFPSPTPTPYPYSSLSNRIPSNTSPKKDENLNSGSGVAKTDHRGSSKLSEPKSRRKPLTKRILKDLIKKSKAGTNQKTLRRNSSTPSPPPPPLPPHPSPSPTPTPHSFTSSSSVASSHDSSKRMKI